MYPLTLGFLIFEVTTCARNHFTKQKFVPLKPFIPNQFERTIWLLSKRFVYWANGYRREKPFINFQPLKMYTQSFGWKVGGVLLFYFYCCSGRNKWMSMDKQFIDRNEWFNIVRIFAHVLCGIRVVSSTYSEVYHMCQMSSFCVWKVSHQLPGILTATEWTAAPDINYSFNEYCIMRGAWWRTLLSTNLCHV